AVVTERRRELVFMESMFSTPRPEAEEPHGESSSAWPALAAALFAWAMAFARVVVGRARQESLNLDVVLAAGASLLIPSIVLGFWFTARRGRRAKPRAELRLVSSVHRVARSAPMHKENTQRSA